jgi:hypothetical protein
MVVNVLGFMGVAFFSGFVQAGAGFAPTLLAPG